ncbi:hypothetical protein AAFF_G00268580 [Aldrovandia affinis]|uniref:Uncharacterized protein n=1 Tax=Aldrovandia affinis TaxID=143900 RepID=A0AAD7SS49_9TELE|nr:hypothetical protein AAFF_G00268580 [Aldrovandia affinis]
MPSSGGTRRCLHGDPDDHADQDNRLSLWDGNPGGGGGHCGHRNIPKNYTRKVPRKGLSLWSTHTLLRFPWRWGRQNTAWTRGSEQSKGSGFSDCTRGSKGMDSLIHVLQGEEAILVAYLV